jgi:hypothetical protein
MSSSLCSTSPSSRNLVDSLLLALHYSFVRSDVIFFHISGVVSEHFCSWAKLIFQDNFCHGLTSDQSVTEIILKNQPRPRAEMFRHDPRNMIKITPEHAKTDRQTERQTDRQTNKHTNKPTPRWSINDSQIPKIIEKLCRSNHIKSSRHIPNSTGHFHDPLNIQKQIK